MQHRDMTEKLFLTICQRHGLQVDPSGSVLLSDQRTNLKRFDGGQRRRDQLDFLLQKNADLPKAL